MLFADVSNPTPTFFFQFVLSIGMVAAIAANVLAVFSLKKTQKREVTFGTLPASKEEFDRLVKWNEKEHDNIFSKLGGIERGAATRTDGLSKEFRELVDRKFTELVQSNDEGRDKLHGRINEILSAVSEMRGRMNHGRGS